ncbi:bifunctional diguanylate cyclase/phosphodiesterase [Hamadaea sp. NPDC051192]|uniref:putative bifunctional diguanylate cyclase/phosphodiesterase n=1 Tax=Hamadaea sp. NPDC051192 TaxID=3154940 RepID=UPI00343AFF21
MSVLDVLRDAGAEFLTATSRQDVAAVVARAVARLADRPDGPAVFADLFPPTRTPPTAAVRRGALVLDRDTAERPDLSVALEVLASQVTFALERVRLTAEIIERHHDRLNTLVEQTSDVILIIDDDDRIRYASPSARVLLGTSALSGASLVDLVDSSERRQAGYLLRYARSIDPRAVAGGSRADWTLRADDGRTVRVEVSCRDLRTDESIRGVVVTLRDVTNQRRLEHELTRRLFRDALTGLPNRLFFDERVSEAIAADLDVTGVLLIDLDNFRAINEALGRETGDAVLQAVAKRLGDAAEDCLIARVGGNEFAVLAANVAGVEIVDELAARLTDAFASPILDSADMLSCTASIGVATTMNAGTAEELLRHADLALDSAKAAGRGNWRRYDPATSTAVGYRLELRTALRQALQDDALLVEYQPIIALGTGHTAGFEALVRWRHPTRGVLSPGEFIDIAEESGLITPIGDWVLATAIRDALEWPRTASNTYPYISINVSVQQFRSSGFVDTVLRLLTETRLPPARLVLEITESLLLRDDDKVWNDLKRLRQWGIRMAIDDFGTGYSALGYLRQVPLDIVKLDRIFISTMATSTRQRELVRGIVQLTRTLGLTVVAEGIETERQRDISMAIGCGYGQGFLFARPMSHEDAVAWTRRANAE